MKKFNRTQESPIHNPVQKTKLKKVNLYFSLKKHTFLITGFWGVE